MLLGLSVGLVLADSSVVTIALPEILAQFDVEVATLAWALTSFNLALAVSALPAAFSLDAVRARLRRRDRRRSRPRRSPAPSRRPSASSSAGRTVQGVAGAAVVCAALDLLAGEMGADAPAARVWALAGVLGASLGPAAGGILTQALGWESIFVVQAPLALVALLVLRGIRAVPVREPVGRPHFAANAALLLVSGALVAALFLLVILLINGWRHRAACGRAGRDGDAARGDRGPALCGKNYPAWARAASGAILISGGLAALGWLPHAGAIWTVPPQIAVGAGLGLALSALTERALAGRSAQVVHGGWTIAARHAGVVLGLLLLTPIFTTDLERNEDDALAAGTSAVLDSRISPLDKLGVARDVLVAVDEAKDEARIPDVEAVVDRRDDPEYARPRLRAPGSARPRGHERILALLPGSRASRPARPRADPARPAGRVPLMRAIAWSAVAAVALIVAYLALGGASYAPAKVADPCAATGLARPGGDRGGGRADRPLGTGRSRLRARRLARGDGPRAGEQRLARAVRPGARDLERAARGARQRWAAQGDRRRRAGGCAQPHRSPTCCEESRGTFPSTSFSTCSIGCPASALGVASLWNAEHDDGVEDL